MENEQVGLLMLFAPPTPKYLLNGPPAIGCHGAACCALTQFALAGWRCGWLWLVLAGGALPAVADLRAAVYAITNEHEQLTQGSSPRGGWSRYLVLAGAATTLGCSLPVGYNIGVINTPAKVLKHFVNGSVIAHYDIALDDTWLSVLWSSVVSIFIVGGCTGSILGALLADNLGRRKATVLTSVISVIGAVIFLVCQVANSVELLILGRLIVGLSAGLTTSIVPMYLSELAPPALTGAMGVACPMGVNVGVLVGQVMGLDFLLGGVDLWPYLLAAYAVLVIICIPFLFILPESPKYLYVVKREEEFALQELSRLRGMSPSILTEDLELLREEVLAVETAALSGAQRWSMLRVLRDPRLRLLLLLTCTMQAGQQTSGINAVFYYSDIIFTNAGLSRLGAQYATIGCGAINVCTAILMVKLLPLWGRRPLLLSSIAAATVLLFALAVSVRFLFQRDNIASQISVVINLLPLWGRRPLLLSSIAAATVLLFALAVSVRFLVTEQGRKKNCPYKVIEEPSRSKADRRDGAETRRGRDASTSAPLRPVPRLLRIMFGLLQDAVAGMPYVCMVTVFGYVLVYGFGLGPIPYFIASEMFEVPPRPAGMAWGSLANWGGNFMVGMSFPVLRDAIGAYSFLVFAAVTAALFVFQRFYFPETRGKTPQQITQLCSRGFRSKPLASQFSEV
ncbi:hypothetical protein MSG28_003134 [Choristoneura fumiferana]|uniref:Uncharacterized protein n=1 Tax=Choristoneura fumiferana TaxID=7141 RepID=A0ACC0KEU8_CHOFU|nr:hypothetical protein MSG28_003134 [Choristoneura fumiferana]